MDRPRDAGLDPDLKLPAMYAAYEDTAARAMVAPSMQTLAEIGPMRAEDRVN